MIVYPSDALYVETTTYKNKVWRENKLLVSDDSNNNIAPKYHLNYITYLKFPVDVDPDSIEAATLYMYNDKFAFVGSTVTVTEAAVSVNVVSPNWDEINGAHLPPEISPAGRFVIANCQYFGKYCGQNSWHQVGPWYSFKWVKMPLMVWNVIDGYIALSVQADAPNNYYVFDNSNNKPYLEIKIKEHHAAPVEPRPTPSPVHPVHYGIPVKVVKVIGAREIIAELGKEKKKVPCEFSTAQPGEELRIFPRVGLMEYQIKIKPHMKARVGFPWRVEVVT